jgi:hypothetical protein
MGNHVEYVVLDGVNTCAGCRKVRTHGARAVEEKQELCTAGVAKRAQLVRDQTLAAAIFDSPPNPQVGALVQTRTAITRGLIQPRTYGVELQYRF